MPIYDERHSQYIAQTFAAEDPVLSNVESRLIAAGQRTIEISPEEGRFLQTLVAISGARLALEFGSLGGYSATWIARALPPGSRLITIEINPQCAEIARETFRLAGLQDKIQLIEGDALAALPNLAAQSPFDFVFIDTTATAYTLYLDWALENTRPGGIIAAHNAFGYGGLFAHPDPDGRKAAIRAINDRFATDPRLLSTIFPAGDGLVFGLVQPPPS